MAHPGPWDKGPPSWRQGPPHWWAGRRTKRRFLFWRFAAIIGAFFAVFLGFFVLFLALVYKPLVEAFPQPSALLGLICGVPLGFAGLAAIIGGVGFRRIGSPVADIMAAADAVANGDLSVRVREQIPGEFGRLARSFNRMTVQLASVEEQRRELTADVAHELRTPLHIIQGNLEGLLEGVYQPTPEMINATLDETRLLARLVNDLQTLSLVESGQLPLHLEPLLAVDLLEDTAAGFTGQAAAAGVELVVQAEGDPSEMTISADPDRMEQVLTNLVANALRYTPSGGTITLRAKPTPQGVQLAVSDNGAGISAEDLPFIFNRFWKGDRSRQRQSGTGSGLGLAIARQLIQAQGGEIRVESQPGQGTTFLIDLSRDEG
jgi:signal transduction histidine kinase